MFSTTFLECGHETVYSFLSAVFLSGSLDRPIYCCPEHLVGQRQCQMEMPCLLIERLTISDGLLLNGFVYWVSRISTTESTSPLSLHIRDG